MSLLSHPIPNFYSGLSGLQLPIPKYKFPPEYQKTSRLFYYSTIFNSIEINSSFYKIPLKTTVKKWSESVNHPFTFTFKLFRDITHVKDLKFDRSDVSKFMDAISDVGSKKGCLLVQFPPSLKVKSIHEVGKLVEYIRKIDPSEQWRVALEFRDRSWYSDDLYSLLAAYNCTLVIQDIPASSTPFTLLSQSVYVRFHGPTGNYRGSYDHAFLNEYAGYIKDWLNEGRAVYVYFNNTMGTAFGDLMALNKAVVAPEVQSS